MTSSKDTTTETTAGTVLENNELFLSDSYDSHSRVSSELLERYKKAIVPGYRRSGDLCDSYSSLDSEQKIDDIGKRRNRMETLDGEDDMTGDQDMTTKNRPDYSLNRSCSYAKIIEKYDYSKNEADVEPSIDGSLMNELAREITSDSKVIIKNENDEIIQTDDFNCEKVEEESIESEKDNSSHEEEDDVKVNQDISSISKNVSVDIELQKDANEQQAETASDSDSKTNSDQESQFYDVEIGEPVTDPDDDTEKTKTGKTMHITRTRRQKFHRTFIMYCILLLALIASCIAIVVMSQAKKSKPPIIPDDASPSAVPTLSPTPPITTDTPTLSPTVKESSLASFPPTTSPVDDDTRFRDIARQLLLITEAAILFNPKTSQNKALHWIVTDDPMQLPIDDARLSQRYVVATLYFSTNGDKWKVCGRDDNLEKSDLCGDDDGNFRFLSGVSECEWYGIRCGSSDDVAREITLEGNKLQGTIPPEISSLDQLEILNLSYNSITGQLPQSSLPNRLHTLTLHNNDIGGPIPPNLDTQLPNLRTLSIGNNQMTGTLPVDMFSPTLTTLDIGGNSFNGSVPEELLFAASSSSSPALATVDMGSNQLTGTISTRWGSLSRLSSLTLKTNRFTGTLPGDVFASPVMTVASFGMNELEGTIPEGLFDAAASLEFLDLGSNIFEGTLSSRWGELTNLKHLVLWKNGFTGSIPSEMGNMRSLEMLQMQFNHLTGDMPNDICQATPAPLSILSADCKPLEGSDEPRVKCDCCTFCSVGYN